MTKVSYGTVASLQKSKVSRGLMVAVPAAVVTLGLFSGMHNLIVGEDFEPSDQPVYELEPYFAEQKPEVIRTTSVKPKPLPAIDPPPMPPALTKTVKTVKLTEGGYWGTPPGDYDGPKFNNILPKRASSMPFRKMIPLTPPVPVYPRRALADNRAGDCTVHFSVSMRGEPFDINADCSHPVFTRAAEKAVSKVKFSPKIHEGLPITVTGVVYPLEFRVNP